MRGTAIGSNGEPGTSKPRTSVHGHLGESVTITFSTGPHLLAYLATIGDPRQGRGRRCGLDRRSVDDR
jgi:hypothetical protein